MKQLKKAAGTDSGITIWSAAFFIPNYSCSCLSLSNQCFNSPLFFSTAALKLSLFSVRAQGRVLVGTGAAGAEGELIHLFSVLLTEHVRASAHSFDSACCARKATSWTVSLICVLIPFRHLDDCFDKIPVNKALHHQYLVVTLNQVCRQGVNTHRSGER